MNKWEIEVQKSLLDSEEAAIKELERQYKKALNEINKKVKAFDADIKQLQEAINVDGLDEAAKEMLKSQQQAKIYQKQYQEALKGQISGVLDNLHGQQYSTIEAYLKDSYTGGYVGTMYDIAKQGVPLIMPIDQAAVVKAVLTDSKVSKGLYNALGVNLNKLKKSIASEVSRGIASGLSYAEIARNISNVSKAPLSRAKVISRTEGHRIQQTATRDAQQAAKAKGADVLKQWDAALDSRTRESHRHVDGEIKELDEKFSNGLMFPGDPNGGAAEVVNCRCTSDTRAKWALDEAELETLKERAAYFGIDKSKNFEEFQQKYLTAAEEIKPQAAAAPKKEYLTEKKLAQKIGDIDKQQAAIMSGYADTDAFLNNAAPAKVKAYKKLETQKADYQDKLDKKLAAKETKALKKELILIQDELDQIEIKTYTGIWKDDITTADYAAKQGSIAAKKAYYENKFTITNDPDAIAKYQALYNQVLEFETEGKRRYELTQRLAATQAKLTNIKKNGKIPSAEEALKDAFSDERKQNALWFTKSNGGFAAADKYFDPPAQAILNEAKAKNKAEFDGFYTYTSSSGGHNRPLAGFQKPWTKSGTGWEAQYFVGPKKVWIDYEGKGDQIRNLTTLIEKSTYPDDVWVQSGQGFGTLAGFLGIDPAALQNMSDAQLQQFVGRRNVFHQFLSTAVNKGGGGPFNLKPTKFNIYVPKGSEALYASDKGAYGKGENEMILQRGGTYEITKIYWGKDDTDGGKRKLFIDLDLHSELGYDKFQQDPNEWKGSKENYRS